jgi:uncharacterized protein (TIGR00288 family)
VQPRIALLIDAENVPPVHWKEIKEQVDSIGNLMTCRLFGDFSGNRNAQWIAHAQRDALQPVMQLAGRNASDIAITIAAMDILYASKIEAICLVTSDADFTPLVHRLKSSGLKVHGMGEDKTPQSLRKACSSFKILTTPSATKTQPSAPAKKNTPTPAKKPSASTKAKTN